MAVYETSASSVVLYSTDSNTCSRQLRIASRVSSTIDLSVATEANGPWSSDTSVPMVEWRLKAFAGDWRTAAAVYRDWLAANRPPVSHANHAWVSDTPDCGSTGDARFFGSEHAGRRADTLQDTALHPGLAGNPPTT